MPINVTLQERDDALWWGPVRVADGAGGRVSHEVWRELIAEGLIRPRLPAGHLHVRRCERCGTWILAHPATRYCRACRHLVSKQQHGRHPRRAEPPEP